MIELMTDRWQIDDRQQTWLIGWLIDRWYKWKRKSKEGKGEGGREKRKTERLATIWVGVVSCQGNNMSRPMAMGPEANGVKTIKKLGCDWETRHIYGKVQGERTPHQGVLSAVCSSELDLLPCQWRQMLKIIDFLGFLGKGEDVAQEERILLSRLWRKGVEMATKSQRCLSIHWWSHIKPQ